MEVPIMQTIYIFESICVKNGSRRQVLNFQPNSKYSGDTNGEKMPHGVGCMLYSQNVTSNCVYVGNWDNGKRNGSGKMTWENKDSYEGNWEDDYMSGHGTFTTADGSNYVGLWKKGKPHGKGNLVHATGNQYEGDWIDGKMEGVGKIVFDCGSVYDGAWEAGEMTDRALCENLKNGAKRLRGSVSLHDDAARRSSASKATFRSSLLQIQDIEQSYQVYPKNFKDFIVFCVILFLCGLSIFLIFHE